MAATEPAAPRTVPAGLVADLERRLPAELGFRLAGVEAVDPGVLHNNRLFRLRAADGRRAMAKLYLRDGRHRLEREHDTLAFLRRRGLRSVSAPLARSDERSYAVYSLEAGENRPASRWTAGQAVAAAAFAVELDRAYQEGVALPPAARARMERVMALLHVAWCGVHLQLLVPELIEKKRFATPNLDVPAHLEDQIAKFHRRLALAREHAERTA